MTKKYHQMTSSMHNQSGIALITVLLFLLLIMIAGAIAVRQGRTDLQVATNDQSNALMFNTADSVLAYTEAVATDPKNPNYSTIFSQTKGILGYFLVNANGRVGEQLSYCYLYDSAEMFSLTKAQITKLGGGHINKGKGLCDPSQASGYTSKRAAAMNQMVVLGMEDSTSDNFDSKTEGTSEFSDSEDVIPKVQINSISVLPAMSNATPSDIKECLGLPVGNEKNYKQTKNLSNCLSEKGVPANMLAIEGLIKDDVKSDATYECKTEGGKEQCTTQNICKDDKNCQKAMATAP